MAMHFGMTIAPWNVFGGGKLLSPEQAAALKSSGETSRSSTEQNSAEATISKALLQVAKAHDLERFKLMHWPTYEPNFQAYCR